MSTNQNDTCETCGGTGEIDQTLGGGAMNSGARSYAANAHCPDCTTASGETQECPRCGGDGEFAGGIACGMCRGRGHFATTRYVAAHRARLRRAGVEPATRSAYRPDRPPAVKPPTRWERFVLRWLT